MKNAERVYFALLRLYPHGYRKAFGKEMLQTFRDYYADVERTDGRVSAAFWLGLLADESKNLVEQHWRAVGENKMALKHVGAKAALFTVLVIPLYFLCSSAYVRILFLIPGWPLMTLGSLHLIALLFIPPIGVGATVSHALVNALVRRYFKHRARAA